MCIDWWNGMRITSRCWRSAIWRFPPRLRNAFTNSRTHCRLEPSWTQKPFEQEMDLLYLYWRVRCWRRQCLSPPRSSFFSLHSVLCALGFVHHHFTLLKKKKGKKKTATGLPPATQKPAHIQHFSKQATFSSRLNKAASPLSTKRAHVPRSWANQWGGWGFCLFVDNLFVLDEVEGSGWAQLMQGRSRGSRGVARWMIFFFLLFFRSW